MTFTRPIHSQSKEGFYLRLNMYIFSCLYRDSSINDPDWDNLGFQIRATDHMFVMKCNMDGEWYKGELKPYGLLELSPSAGVLNYGQVCI